MADIGKEQFVEIIESNALDLRAAAFPSDELSVGQLRKLFPGRFDQIDQISNGYSKSNFFFSATAREPEHLNQLARIISDERTIASSAFRECLCERFPELLNSEDLKLVAEAKVRLALSYQYFRLADGPQSADELIRRVESAGRKQAGVNRSVDR